MRPFAVYPDSFDGDTLGWWRFGERGGRLDGVVGPAFTNFGAEPRDDGYRFVRTDGDHMDATFADQPVRSELTFECWVRDFFETPSANWSYRQVFQFWLDVDNRTSIMALRRENPAESRIRAELEVGGVGVGVAQWIGADADALLASGELWHVAAVLDAPNSFRLFVNGIQRGQDLAGILALPTGTFTLLLGRHQPGWGGYDLDGILDEVRLSKSIRYVGGANGTRYFTPARFQDGQRAVIRGPGMQAGLTAGVIQ